MSDHNSTGGENHPADRAPDEVLDEQVGNVDTFDADPLLAIVRERLVKMERALEDAAESDSTPRIEYCTKCDEYSVDRQTYLPCDWISDESELDHNKYIVIGDYEESSIYGYILALEWVCTVLDGDDSDG